MLKLRAKQKFPTSRSEKPEKYLQKLKLHDISVIMSVDFLIAK
jgi:hypothetical protein